MTGVGHIARYLEGLAALCLETAARPELLPTFLPVLSLVPRTLAELARGSGARGALAVGQCDVSTVTKIVRHPTRSMYDTTTFASIKSLDP
jgi:hypothetical protein